MRDRAAFLVAALRARGLQADFALVQWLFHMSNELPTLDNFDTPLVVITGPSLKAPIWLDVMYGNGPNDVTLELGGKRALPIRSNGAELVELPREHPRASVSLRRAYGLIRNTAAGRPGPIRLP